MTTPNPPTVSREDMIKALATDRFAGFWDCLNLADALHKNTRISGKYDAYCQKMLVRKKRYELRLGYQSPSQLEGAFRKLESEVAHRSPHDERKFFNEPIADADYGHWASLTARRKPGACATGRGARGHGGRFHLVKDQRYAARSTSL